MFAGISQAGQGIAHGLAQLGQAMERKKEEEKQRARMFKGYQEMLDVMGIATKDQTAPMGLEAVEGLFKGTMLKQAQAEQDQRRKLVAEQLLDLMGRRESNTALQNFGRDIGGMMEPPQVLSPEAMTRWEPRLSGANIGAALSRNPGAVTAPQFDNMLGVLLKSGRPALTPGTVQPVPDLPGYMFGIQSETGAGSFLPTGTAVKPETPLQSSQRELNEEKVKDLKGKREAGMASNVPPETQRQMKELQREIDADQAEIAKGDKQPGPDWLPWIGSRKARVQANQAALQVLQTKYPPPASAAPAGGAQGSAKKTDGTVDTEAVLAEANDAIQRGADPAAVKKRLKEKYGIVLK